MASASVGPNGGLVGPDGGLVGPDSGVTDTTLTPSPVTIPILTTTPLIARDLRPDPVTIPILTTTPAVIIDKVLTPDPVTIPIVLPIPYMAYAGRIDLRLSQLAVEIALTPDVTPVLVTEVGTEVIYSSDGSVHVTEAGAEVIFSSAGAVQVTVVGIEVIRLPEPRRRPWAEFID